MAAEQNRAERHLLLSETEELLHRESEARQQLFDQENFYIVAEGISGIEDRYVPPAHEELPAPAAADTPSSSTLPQQSISVRELVASSDTISSMQPVQTLTQNSAAQQLMPPPDVKPQAAAPVQPASAQVAAPPQPEIRPATPQAAVSRTLPVLPVSGGIDQQIRAQEQTMPPQPAVRQVTCEEIKNYMDSTDLGVFRYAVTKPEGVVTPWKGPGGSYTLTAGAAHGVCRNYMLQAQLRIGSLRCQFSCAQAGVVRSASLPRSDKEVIRAAMNSSDQEAFLQALNYHGPVSWRSSSGIFYTVAPVRLSGPCREYDVQANMQGRVFRYLESSCE